MRTIITTVGTSLRRHRRQPEGTVPSDGQCRWFLGCAERWHLPIAATGGNYRRNQQSAAAGDDSPQTKSAAL